MKKSIITLTLAFAGLLGGLSAQTVILEDDFSSLPVGVDLADKSTWWGPSWNGGDIAYSRVTLDGPGGIPSLTKTTEVFAGRFYGGGMRNAVLDMPALASPVDPSTITVSFWLKGASTESRGQVGFSIIGFDSSSGSNVEAGAGYYLVPIAPADWTQITFTMADMADGIPGHGTSGIPFDFVNADKFQIFIWTRNEFETGWPIQENEGHIWSWSIADLSIVAEGGSGPATWAGFEIVDGWVDTGAFMGSLYVESAPWVYSLDLADYIYLPEEHVGEAGAWSYIFK